MRSLLSSSAGCGIAIRGSVSLAIITAPRKDEESCHSPKHICCESSRFSRPSESRPRILIQLLRVVNGMLFQPVLIAHAAYIPARLGCHLCRQGAARPGKAHAEANHAAQPAQPHSADD